MTRSELTIGSLTFLAVIAAGWLSEKELDRRFAAAEANKSLATNQRLQAPTSTLKPAPKPQPELTPEPEPPRASGACVDKDGSWKNWPFPNVPMLSPKC